MNRTRKKDDGFRFFELKLDLHIEGDGSSIWGPSKGNYHIITGELQGCCVGEDDEDDPFGIWELQLYGPDTEPLQYTDKKIEEQVNQQLKELCGKHIGCKVDEIGWSEWGMQPEHGWSFDVTVKE